MGNTMKYEAMELTPLEKRIIMESWMTMRRKLSICGQTFILIFFESYPEHLSYFPQKYRGNPDLAEMLGLKLMREFSRIVSNLDALADIATYLKDVARNHQPRHIDPKAFDDLRLAFLKMLRCHLVGQKHLNLYLQCWDKLLRLINTILVDLMSSIDKKKTHHHSVLIDQSPDIQTTPKYEPVPTAEGDEEESPKKTRIKFACSVDDL